MEERLKEIRAYSLSNTDINDILEPDTKIFSYPEFAKTTNIDQAFDGLGRCVFLFLTESPSVGHWCCMFKRNGYIEYFSSYGDPPEAERSWVTQEQLDALGEDKPYLMNLLQNSRSKVYYSTHQYQKEKKDYNSCGRWCVARLICKDLSNQQFYNLVQREMKANDIKEADTWVCFFTADILGK